MLDKFQQRYLEHIERKKKFQTQEDKPLYSVEEKALLCKVINNRRSQRTFNKEPIVKEEVYLLLEAVRDAPSSCNRHAIQIKIFDKVEDLLVGSKGWIDRADKIFLLFAHMIAYKSPNEVDFMPYLDTGVIVENLYLIAEVLNIGACFINPNIREENREQFNTLYNKEGYKFCGAMVFGHYDKKAVVPPKEN